MYIAVATFRVNKAENVAQYIGLAMEGKWGWVA
jgi:hypothetical protein